MLTTPKQLIAILWLSLCFSISALNAQFCPPGQPDNDNDGVCNTQDQCPNFDNSLIGSSCDDGKSCTTNDRWTTECDCEGTPISDPDNDGICGSEDQCSNFDDDLDIDDDGIPYCQDDCIDVNENGICDDVDTAPFTNKLKVYFSLKRGFYNSGIQVSLIANRPNTNIRYELGTDPNCPTVNSGNSYNGPISIGSQGDLQTLKVIASNGGETTKVYTHTYIFSGHEKPTVVFSCSPYDVAPGKDEVPISFEFIVPSSNPLKSIQEYASTKPSAGGVQAGTSDKIYFRSAYGAGTLKEDLFSDFYYGRKPVNQFDQLFLRGDHSYGTRLNQIIAHDALRATEQLSPAGRNVYFYEFGNLEDIRHLQERPESGFMEAWTGFDKPNWEAYSGDQQSGLISRINNGDWEETKRLVNIESFGNFLLNQWVANCWDFWDNRNYRTAGPTDLDAADGKDLRWHYFNWDWDLAFPDQRTSWRHSAFQSPEDILGDIRENEEFDLRFADIIQCAMYDNGPLTADRYNERVLARHNELQDLLYRGNPFDVVYNISDVTDYIPVRVNWLKNELTDNNYYPDLSAVRYSQNEGTLAAGERLTLSNPSRNGNIYYTLDGSDVRSEAGVLNPDAIRYTGPITLPPGVHDVFARVYNPSASSLIDRWSATCGSRVYYVDQDYSNIIINEIHYSPVGQAQGAEVISGKNFEFIELRNNGSSPVDLKGSRFSKGVELDFEESLMIAPGGYLVFAENATSFESRYGFAPDAQYSGKLSNEGEKINLKDPFGYFIDTVRYNNKNIWDEGVDSTGFSLELLHESLDNNNPLNWFRSDNIGGTPRADNSRTCPQAGAGIVINEINYNSSDDFNPGDWVELHNPTASAIDISGWSLYDTGDEFVIPDGTTLAPEGFVVLVAKEADFKAAFPNINDSKIIGELPYGLSSKGERITLFDSNKCLADYVIFNDKAPWPEAPDGDGPSLSLLEPGLDNALAESWESSMIMNASFVHGSPSVSNVCEPGQSCDDGDECTSNDTFDNDCNCVGTQEDADSDGDGVCDIADICDGFDDNLIGTPCDDGNECSVGETYDTDCGCSGGIIGDIDNDGLCDALDDCDNNLTGTSCEDGDPCTIGETYDINCNCTGGVLADSDNDGICNELDLCDGFDDKLFGQICDDGNPQTEFDMYNADACGCAGIVVNAETCSRINTGSDDAEETASSGSVSLTSSDLELVEEGFSGLNIVGMRFTNMQIPQGATISDAKIQFTTDETDSGATTVTIVGENADNPSTFTTEDNNITNRPTTSASETWTIDPWSTVGESGSTQQTVDISAIIQEIVNRPNFQSGNAIVLMVNAGSGARVAESFNGNEDSAPELCVSYNTGTCQVGYPCDDNDPATENDRLTEDCGCAGEILDPCAAFGGDTDGDGVCDLQDCYPENPNLSTPGQACDDGNPDTSNDVVQGDCACLGLYECNTLQANIGDSCDDGNADTDNDQVTADCECAGIDPCVADGGDTDGDGVCNLLDCFPEDANLSSPGDACDDNNPATINDVLQGDCGCVGQYECNDLQANIGDSCDDNNPDTDNDIVTSDCNCAGVDPCADLGGDTDGDGVCNEQDCFPEDASLSTPGDACDDNNPATINDVLQGDCGCVGTTVDADNDGDGFVASVDCDDNNALISEAGDACDDNNADTENDEILADCSCAGTLIDTDGDGVTDSADCAPTDAALPTAPGTTCDDGDATTENDMIAADGCDCLGTKIDADGDGIPVDMDCDDNDDAVPTTPGTACDDANADTENDMIAADGCTCMGTTIVATNTLNITGINYNPSVDDRLDGDDFEFLFITNYGTTDVSVAGDSILGIDFVFAAGEMIAAGETVMLTKGMTNYPSITFRRILWPTDGKLANKGEQLIFKKSDNTEINNLTFDDKDPWPIEADGDGSYLKLISEELDNTDPANWEAAPLPTELTDVCSVLGGDVDGDGVCGNIDCDDTDATVASIGSTCDDGDDTTENDIIGDDCTCAGTPIVNETLNITGINYNPLVEDPLDEEDFEFLFVTNYGDTDIVVAGDSILGIDFVFPAGEVIAAGETVMLVKDLTIYPDVDARKILWTGSKLSNGGEQLIFKKPNNSVVNDLEYDDKDLWPTAADGGGSYLQLKSPELDNTIPENWEAVAMPLVFGSCADNGGDADGDGVCANTDCDDNDANVSFIGDACDDGNSATENDVIVTDCVCAGTPVINDALNITGINYNPLVDSTLVEEEFEFLLITNYGTSDVSIAGDSILGIGYEFPAGSMIAAGETVMLTKGLNNYPSLDYRRILWDNTSKLSNKGEQLTFKKPDNGIINDLEYDDKTPWPVEADGGGFYLQLKADSLDNTIPENWEAIALPAALDTTIVDSDGDGVPAADDCDDNDASVPTTPGTACDDDNDNTENDVIGNDGCSCTGTPIVVVDNDGDGVPAADDCDDNDDSIPAAPGSSCDDANANTENDVIGNDGCSCTGTTIVVVDNDGDGVPAADDCDDNDASVPTIPGTACDDANANTENDVIGNDGCSCTGTTIVVVDNDGDGVPAADDCDDNDASVPTIPGTACDDANANTENDVIGNDGCSCTGTTIVVVDNDGDGVPAADDCDDNDASVPTIPGTACDDANANTENDVIGTDGCSCTGTTIVVVDNDGDGVPAADDCDDNDASVPTTPGTTCDDANANTENDVIGTDGCSCTGTTIVVVDNDGDGVPAADDCDDNDASVPTTPGTTCDDANANTENDVIGTDGCSCAGTPINTGDCVFAEVDFNDFENGQGIWNDPGTDCAFMTSPDGSQSIRIRDNNRTSFTATNILDFTGAKQTKIEFAYTGESMEDGEDFLLEYSLDGGETFIIAQTWVSGTDFQNDVKVQETVTIAADFTATTIFLFRCDASSNYDRVFLDDIRISSCNSGNDPEYACPALLANIGDTCDDANANTENDIVTATCECAGTLISVVDCPDLNGNVGDTCDDNDTATENDVITDDCGCAGEIIFDCTDLNANVGDTCNDNDPNTANDVITSDCNCAGTVVDTSGCTLTIFSSTDFELGFGDWIDGGNDASVINNGANGSASKLRLRDNSGTKSSIYTEALNFTNVVKVQLDFLLQFQSMEDDEDFIVEYSLDGGDNFITAREYISGVNFNNGDDFEAQTVTIMDNFTANTVIRFRADASSNYDRVFLDDIQISTCGNVIVAPVVVGNIRTSFDLEAEKQRDAVQLSVSHRLAKEAAYINVNKLDIKSGKFLPIEDIIVAEQNGSYTIVDNNIIEGENTYQATIYYTDGTEETTELSIVTFNPTLEYNVFPNPTTDIINVNLEDYLGTKVQVILYNIQGQVISLKSYDELQDPEVSFDMTQAKAGTYLITVDAEGQRGTTKKFNVVK